MADVQHVWDPFAAEWVDPPTMLGRLMRYEREARTWRYRLRRWLRGRLTGVWMPDAPYLSCLYMRLHQSLPVPEGAVVEIDAPKHAIKRFRRGRR